MNIYTHLSLSIYIYIRMYVCIIFCHVFLIRKGLQVINRLENLVQ